MRELGLVIDISASGYAMVRNPDTPRIGMPVYDGNGKKIGDVHDIIGPTRNPFILVSGDAKVKQKLFV